MRREHKNENEYTFLNWVQPQGRVIVNVGILNTAGTTSIDTEFSITPISPNSGSEVILITMPNAGVQIYTNNNRIYNQGVSVNVSLNQTYIVTTHTTSTRREITVNGTTQAQTMSRSITDNAPLYIFGSPYQGGQSFSNDIFKYFKVWRNSVLERDLVPALRNIDREIGLYDNIYGNFYTNQETGHFIYG